MTLSVRRTKVHSRRAVAFLFSSAGELDVILPALHADKVAEFRIVVFKSEIFQRILSDEFYSSMIGDRIDNRSLPGYSKSKIIRWVQFLRNSLATVVTYLGADQFYFEYGHAGREKNILIPLLLLLGRSGRIRYHPHGHAVTDDLAYSNSNRPMMIRISTRLGSRIVKLNGVAPTEEFLSLRYPILLPAWKRYVVEHAPQIYCEHVVILSRDAHPAYLLEENRAQMFRDVLQLFDEFFPGSDVVVKAHPRETLDRDIFGKTSRRIVVSYDNTYSVVRGARFAVSFWTSAFFQCLALEVPVAEYHIPHRAFQDLYPKGSLNGSFLPTFQGPDEFRNYLKGFVGEGGR